MKANDKYTVELFQRVLDALKDAPEDAPLDFIQKELLRDSIRNWLSLKKELDIWGLLNEKGSRSGAHGALLAEYTKILMLSDRLNLMSKGKGFAPGASASSNDLDNLLDGE